MNLKSLQQLLKKDIQQLNNIIRLDLDSDVALICEISNYIISAGGKRIRPLLTILCGIISGYDFQSKGDLIYKMATMIEYIHTATLLHDDVVDESNMRRGRKTANATFGNAISVLVGDFIYTRAFQLMVESDSIRLLKIMADSTNKISEGEVMQLLNIGRSDLTEEEYFAVIKHKTATLFEAAARAGAIISNSNIEQENLLAKYAINVGNAFQIMDDILDYNGDAGQMGKNIGDDLKEGKITLPLIYILKHGTEQEKNLISQSIQNPNDDVDIESIITIVKQSNAIQYCLKLSHDLVDNAKQCLVSFSDSEYKQAMLYLADSAIERNQ